MQTRVYKSGSIVYFTGDNSDRVYILKQGQAQSIFLSEETGYETRELINIGEFFGVKSILGTYPQEDTVQCLTDCVVIIITYEEFESLVSKNKPIIIKMLKVFSNQLRRINKRVRELVENDINEEAPDSLEGLYGIGEFYFRNKKYRNALYAYKRYLQYADEDSSFYNTVKEKIEECKDELDITDDSDIAPPDNIGTALNNSSNIRTQIEINDPEYKKAVDYYNSNDFINSIKIFNNLLKSQNTAAAENAIFYIGKCYYNINKYENASNVLLAGIKKYPKSKNVKEAILYLAKSCEGLGNNTKAKAYYQKVISMPPMDNFSKEANANISKL